MYTKKIMVNSLCFGRAFIYGEYLLLFVVELLTLCFIIDNVLLPYHLHNHITYVHCLEYVDTLTKSSYVGPRIYMACKRSS